MGREHEETRFRKELMCLHHLVNTHKLIKKINHKCAGGTTYTVPTSSFWSTLSTVRTGDTSTWMPTQTGETSTRMPTQTGETSAAAQRRKKESKGADKKGKNPK